MNVARRDPRLRAEVIGRTPLYYAAGPDPGRDRPAHVRAASAVVRWRGGLLVVQDDAAFVGWIRPDGAVSSLDLPAGPDGRRLFDDLRGNKGDKLDLEAAFALPCPAGDVIVALGSGSSPVRERIVVIPLDGEPGAARVFDGKPLYDALRDALPGELNVEGAFPWAGGVRLLQRGNGRDGANATADVDAAWFERLLAAPGAGRPTLTVRPWNLGALSGAPLTFTDGLDRGEAWWFLATAEASPDAVRDGPVTGSVLGRGGEDEAVWAPFTEGGRVPPLKAEGLCPSDRPGEVLVVVDADDPQRPAELLRIALDGPWEGSGSSR